MVGTERVRTDPVLELLGTDDHGYRRLYYLWEQQQWEATQIPLRDDAESWDRLDPVLRRAVGDATEWMHLRAHAATGMLTGYVDAAPTEEIGVFLTTQLADEARHLVFADRYRAEVIGRAGEVMADRAPVVEEHAPAARVIAAVADVAGSLRPADPSSLAEALGAYQLAVVGALGSTLVPFLMDALEEAGRLPGWRSGMALAARDSQRHAAFALRVVAETDPGLRAAGSGLDRVMPSVRSMLAALAGAAPLPGAAELEARSDALVQRWVAAVSGEGER